MPKWDQWPKTASDFHFLFCFFESSCLYFRRQRCVKKCSMSLVHVLYKCVENQLLLSCRCFICENNKHCSFFFQKHSLLAALVNDLVVYLLLSGVKQLCNIYYLFRVFRYLLGIHLWNNCYYFPFQCLSRTNFLFSTSYRKITSYCEVLLFVKFRLKRFPTVLDVLCCQKKQKCPG